MLKIPAPGCSLCGSGRVGLKWRPGFRTLHYITLNPGGFARFLPEEDEFQAIGHLFVATINSQFFALFSNPERHFLQQVPRLCRFPGYIARLFGWYTPRDLKVIFLLILGKTNKGSLPLIKRRTINTLCYNQV